jgi:hypothetical protein
VSNLTKIIVDAFLDGFTGAGLFGKLRRPGAPTEYVDSRSVEEFKASGEFEVTVRRYERAVSAMQADRANSTPGDRIRPKGDRTAGSRVTSRR